MIRTGVALLCVAVTASSAFGQTPTATPSTPTRAYVIASIPSYFGKAWDESRTAGACANSPQTKAQYLDSVHDFFFGTLFVDGWFHNEDAWLAKFSPAIRNRLELRLNALGQRAAAEWAKDNGCRRIRSSPTYNPGETGKPSLEEWRDALKSAAAGDSGDAKTFEAAIAKIAKQVDDALK